MFAKSPIGAGGKLLPEVLENANENLTPGTR